MLELAVLLGNNLKKMNTVTDGKKAETTLCGKAMPKLIDAFSEAVVGRRIVAAGYDVGEDSLGDAVPILVLDDGHTIYAMRDDECNGPGVICSTKTDAILCHTSPK